MRKLFLLGMLFAATTGFSQIVIWNGEDKESGSDGGFWGRADPTVVEEGGNKCLKITTKANPNPEDWPNEHFNAHLPFSADFKGLRRLSFRIKMEPGHNVLLKLKHGSVEAHRLFYYGGGNTWKKLNFEFSVGPNKDDIADNQEMIKQLQRDIKDYQEMIKDYEDKISKHNQEINDHKSVIYDISNKYNNLRIAIKGTSIFCI